MTTDTTRPGTKVKDVDYACGMEIQYDDVQACGDNVRTMAERAQGTCSCAVKLIDFWTGADGQVAKQDSEDKATSAALRQAAELAVCVAENGFNVQSNQAAAMQKLTSSSETYFIVFPELDTTMYVDLIDRLVLCAFSDCDSLVSFFTDYMEKACKFL